MKKNIHYAQDMNQSRYDIPDGKEDGVVSEPIVAYTPQPIEHINREVLRQLSNIAEDREKMQRTLDFLVAMSMQDRAKLYDGITSQLEALKSYDTDWDGYGASSVSIPAIQNSRALMQGIECRDPLAMEVMPSHSGAVIFKYSFGGTVIRGEIGPESVSFYIRRKGLPTEYHNDEPWNADTIDSIRNLVREAL